MEIVQQDKIIIPLDRSGHGRTKDRPHVSDLVRTIGVARKTFPPEDNLEDPENWLRLHIGLAWEDYLSSYFPWIEYHFGEVERDGIVGTPDGFTHECPETGYQNIIEEFKVTWKSGNKGPGGRDWEEDQWWAYMTQLKCYCHMLEADLGRMWIVWVNWMYSPPKPEFHRYLIQFDAAELRQNWKMITRTAYPEMRKPKRRK